MSVSTPRTDRHLSEPERRAFEALRLSPGHWGALAPAALFRRDLRPVQHRDMPSLHDLRLQLQSTVGSSEEAERFWGRIVDRGIGEHQQAAYTLLGWHLANDQPRPRREAYLEKLGRVAGQFQTHGLGSFDTQLRVIGAVRMWVEAYLGMAAYDPDVSEPVVDPPDPGEVARLFGTNLWKQTLTAPLVAALGARNARPGEVYSLVRRLAYVTEPGPGSVPGPLERHLMPGWLALFGGLFDASANSGAPALGDAVRLAVRGLASLRRVEERERILYALGREAARTVVGPDRDSFAARWVDRLREQVEDVIRDSRRRTTSPSLPVVDPVLVTTPALHRTADPIPATALTEEALPPVTPLVPPTPPPTCVTVREAVAAPRMTLDKALAAARTVSVGEIHDWLTNPEHARSLLFDDQRGECPEVAVVRDPALVPPALWVVGDVHADILTLANIVAHAEAVGDSEGVPPAFLFLGDFVDRGRHDHETLLFLFALILKHPRRVCVLAGNHDIDLQWDTKAGRFVVSIEPAEYCERLNGLLRSADPADAEQVRLAKLLVPYWQSRPKALFLPDGTMYAHGGFPHTDTHEALKSVPDLARPACLSDFLWARIAERPKKRPNRGNRGHEFGWNDFADFCKVSARLGLPPVARLVRGHDHVADRWQFFPEYAAFPVLTINAMGRRMEGEPPPDNRPHPYPVVARHVPGALPVVVQLPLDPDEVDRAFGRPPRPEPPPDPVADGCPGGPHVDAPGDMP